MCRVETVGEGSDAVVGRERFADSASENWSRPESDALNVFVKNDSPPNSDCNIDFITPPSALVSTPMCADLLTMAPASPAPTHTSGTASLPGRTVSTDSNSVST